MITNTETIGTPTTMKIKTPTNPAELEALMISEAADHVQTAENFARNACKHALLAGMRLQWLHSESVSMGGDRRSISVSRETLKKGFDGALQQIGLHRPTAYRWINATYAAALSIGIAKENFPAPGTANWNQLQDILCEIAAKTSLRRLVLGHCSANTDEHRLEELIGRAEAGDVEAENVLEMIAAGKFTLVQAMRAAAGALATKGKERTDPVYLTFDDKGKIGGLGVKSMVTLINAAKQWTANWEDIPDSARAELRKEWLKVSAAMPDELKSYKQ